MDALIDAFLDRVFSRRLDSFLAGEIHGELRVVLPGIADFGGLIWQLWRRLWWDWKQTFERFAYRFDACFWGVTQRPTTFLAGKFAMRFVDVWVFVWSWAGAALTVRGWFGSLLKTGDGNRCRLMQTYDFGRLPVDFSCRRFGDADQGFSFAVRWRRLWRTMLKGQGLLPLVIDLADVKSNVFQSLSQNSSGD